MKNRLLKIVLCLLLVAAVPVTAQQKFHIVSFDESPLDMTARDAQHEKIDGNGDRFAIVKVTSTSADDDLRAAITIYGKPAGETPIIVENLLIGEHKVTLSKNGYKRLIRNLVLET